MTYTLRDFLPIEAVGCEYEGARFRQYLDMPAVETAFKDWPGEHKNVHSWWYLENGMAVGWNENPGRGWSFPVISKNVAKSPFVNGLR